MTRARAPGRARLLGCALLSASLATTAAAPTLGAAPKLTLTADAAAVPVVRKGVVVVAVGDASGDGAFVLARAVYAHAEVRPNIVDRDAQILAGAKPEANAPKESLELADLRAKVHGDDVASRLLLAEIARRTQARAVALVYAPVAPETAPRAQLYDAADDAIEPTVFRPGGDAKIDDGWSLLVATMLARWSPTGNGGDASKTDKTEKTEKPEKSSAKSEPEGGNKLITSSVWFWVAVGAAVVAGGVVYLTTRDSGSTTTPLRVQWGK